MKPEQFLEDLENRISNEFFSQENIQRDADKLFTAFHDIFYETADGHAPIRDMTNRERERTYKPWITRAILKKK